jgi:hypothetical protein
MIRDASGIRRKNARREQEEVMSVRWRHFLLSVALASSAVTPAVGQAERTAVPPAVGATGSATPVPDFSGMWVHPYFPGIEPPASGPGPVLNTLRRPDGVNDPRRLVGDYANPILKPHAADLVKTYGEISLAGMTYPTPSNQCWPSGVPYIFFQIGVQFLQQQDTITILHLRDHEVRRVSLNQPHPAPVTPSWYGDSVGHYDGDTLVIDTVGIKTDRPHAMLDMYGTPYSRALHVVERYRLIDYADFKAAMVRNNNENVKIPEMDFDRNYRGKHLQLVFTVEDEGVFTRPWSATITYARPAHEWEEHVCAENIVGFYSTGPGAAVPTASRPDF